MNLRRSGGDDVAKVPFAVVPVCAGTGAKIAEVRMGPVPHPHPSSGKSVMREMQRREQGGFVADIERSHKAIKHNERRIYRSLIGLGLSFVDGDNRSASR